MLARFLALKRSDRLRATGWFVLAAGLVAGAGFYWANALSVDPALDDANALGYTRSMQHQMGVMMGHFGLMLTGWQDALTSPAGEALLIVAGAALLAGYFFRVAWVLDEEARDDHP